MAILENEIENWGGRRLIGLGWNAPHMTHFSIKYLGIWVVQSPLHKISPARQFLGRERERESYSSASMSNACKFKQKADENQAEKASEFLRCGIVDELPSGTRNFTGMLYRNMPQLTPRFLKLILLTRSIHYGSENYRSRIIASSFMFSIVVEADSLRRNFPHLSLSGKIWPTRPLIQIRFKKPCEKSISELQSGR